MSPDRRSPLVLLVDDEPDIRELCRINLELHGCEVLEAAEGGAALDLVRHERPDVVFLDARLPDRSGWSVLGELRADPELGEVPVVLLTASVTQVDRERAAQEGAAAFLGKPFDPADLLRLVDELANGSRPTGG